MLAVEPGQPPLLRGALQLRLCRFGQRQKISGVPRLHGATLPTSCEPVESKFLYGLQHREARFFIWTGSLHLVATQQAFVYQGADAIEKVDGWCRRSRFIRATDGGTC